MTDYPGKLLMLIDAAAVPDPRPLTGGEIFIVVIIMVLATVLTVAGLPMFGIAELLGGAVALVLRVLRRGGGGGSTLPAL